MSSDPQLDANGIVQRQFTTARRGYDADEVRAYLHELATLVGTVQRREAELRERADKAESRAQKAEQLDEHRLVEILGEETARVLDAARAASTDIRGKAEESASRLISEANQEAHRVRAEAEAALATQRTDLLAEVEKLRTDAASELDRRRAEGAEIVAQMRREAQAECDSLRQQGEQKRIEAEMQAETIRSKAREEGRALIAEAQVVRERVLGDLARRRRSAREQLERLNAARERLLAAYEVVRRTVDEATSELTVVLPEAKIAGDSAMRRVKGEPEPSVEQLEDMVAMARITGLLEDAGQTIDDEDYLADDAPPPEVAANGATAGRAGVEPVELYDVEAEADLVAGDDLDVLDGDLDVLDGGGAGDVELPEDGQGTMPAAARTEPVPVNGHARPVENGSTSSAPPAAEVVPAPAALAPEPRQPVEAWSAATVGLESAASGAAGGATSAASPPSPPPSPSTSPSEADAASPDPDPDPEPVALAESESDADADADLAWADDHDDPDEPAPADRRVNGHAHLAVDVDEDGNDIVPAEDYADDGYVEGADDGWPEDDDVPDASSSVDELFARLRAGRDRPVADPVPGPAADHDGDHESDDGADHDEAEDAASAARRARVSALAAMSDADILASAGYGDEYGSYGPGDDDVSGGTAEGDEYDELGLTVARPDPPGAVEGLGGLGDLGDIAEDDDGDPDAAAFEDMDADEAMLRLRDDSLETVEHDLSRRLKRVLADEQNEVLDTLRRHKPSTIDDLLPGGSEAHVARYAEAAVEGLNTAAAWGAASVEGEPDGSYDALAGELGLTVVEPLRERIARSFAEAGGDVDDVTSRLRSLYREWKGHHIAAAAQHYAVAAYARGAYEAVPAGTPVRWLVDRGGDACPDADDNALAGSVCKGEAFPTGDRCAPAHPGCRCMVVPLDWPQLG